MTQSPITRDFLGWRQPALPEAARRLADRYRQANTLDLGKVIVVVPGQRAGRRLVELLAYHAEDEKLLLTPPRVVTEGKLPELLYTPKFPFADDLTQDLAWAKAFRELPADRRRHIVPHPPADDEPLRWLELGKVIRGVHRELAADGLDFSAVLTHGPKLAGFAEAERWSALVELQARYHALLDKEDLWDIQSARLVAIKNRNEIATDCDIILLGTVDLNDSLRQMLDQVAALVTAYIVAPLESAGFFDPHGCLVSESWRDAELPLTDDQIEQADGPAEQAEAVTNWLARLDAKYRTDEIAIGVPDQTLVPQLQRQLQQCNLPSRWVEGTKLTQTAPYRLLAAAVQFAAHRRYEDLAVLLRHPEVEHWLESAPSQPQANVGAMLSRPSESAVATNGTIRPRKHEAPSHPTIAPQAASSLPAQLDRYYNAHLPSRIRSAALKENPADWPDLPAAIQHLEAWLADTAVSLPLRDWGRRFSSLLSTIYANRTLNLDEPTDQDLHDVMQTLLEVCEHLGSLPPALDLQPIPAPEAFQIAFGPLAREALAPPANPEAIELLGWLELPLDDSPALIVTTFNEGFVPQSTNSDPFLPDRLRRKLGILHNERRYARDAYALSVLCHSREKLKLLVAKRDLEGDPLQPSRLLFACPDDTLVKRAKRFFAGRTQTAPARRLLLATSGPIPPISGFKVPPATPSEEKLKRISVTRFKVYLACPFRYYLQHVLKLEVMNDAARELDGSAFGNLLHGTLSAFGRHPASPRQSTNERDIFDFLNDRMERIAFALYGSDGRRPSIRLQLEQARHRLRAFALHQAALVREGWQIVHAEDEQDGESAKSQLSVPFPVNGESIDLIGRIDRIDFNEQTGTVRILDYKTADTPLTPEKSHRDKNQWSDLQLPLYRHLWRAAWQAGPQNCTVELGYFNLPKTPDDTKVELAKWNPVLLDGADEAARAVICKLWQNHFGPPVYPPPDFSDDFAAICLDNVLGGPDSADNADGGPQ